MPMDSKRLSNRLKQPGHDVTFRVSETNFIKAARDTIGELFEVNDKPKDLKKIFRRDVGKALGIEPEASIVSPRTGRKFFVEVKKQKKGGNAEERAAKHHTVEFYKTLQNFYGYRYHPYVTVCCDSLATESRYTSKFPYIYEQDQYFLWVDYQLDILRGFLVARCAAWLEDE